MVTRHMLATGLIAAALIATAPAMAQAPIPVPMQKAPMDGPARARLAAAAQLGGSRAQYRLGMSYMNAGDYASGLPWIRKAAESGYAQAQFELGTDYEGGQGVPADNAQAVVWLTKAADQGFGIAQDFLGEMYHDGKGVAKDDITAWVWLDLSTTAQAGQAFGDSFTKERDAIAATLKPAQLTAARARVAAWHPAEPTLEQQANAAVEAIDSYHDDQALALATPAAEAGNAHAQFVLGMMYHMGFGVKQDDAAAAVWYQKAADQGQAGAQFALSGLYYSGQGVVADEAHNFDLTQNAANQGLPEAQYGMGRIYLDRAANNGDDETKAAYWFQRAAAQGHGESQLYLAMMTCEGKGGITKDAARCYMWVSLALQYDLTDETRKKGDEVMANLTKELTPDDIAKGEALAAAWQPVFEVP